LPLDVGLDPVRGALSFRQVAHRTCERFGERCVSRGPRRRRTDGHDCWSNLRLRIEPSDETAQLALAPEAGSLEDLGVPLAAEVRADHQEPREVNFPSCDELAQLRKLADEPRGLRAASGGVLAHAELVQAIGVEARAGTPAMDAAHLDLPQVGKQLGERDIGFCGQPLHTGEEIVVGERTQRCVHHMTLYTLDLGAPEEARGRAWTLRDASILVRHGERASGLERGAPSATFSRRCDQRRSMAWQVVKREMEKSNPSQRVATWQVRSLFAEHSAPALADRLQGRFASIGG
jgi:hypothetical protein